MDQELPPLAPADAALVKQVKDTILADLDHWEPDFIRMKANRRFARGFQWRGMVRKDLTDPDRPYTANITMRHLKQSTAATYARNPRFTWRRSQRLYHKLWDGTAATLQQAMMASQQDPQGTSPMGMMAMAILREAAEYAEQQRIFDKTGETLAILYEYFLREQVVPTKAMMKRMVLQAKTCGVGYVKQAYQRSTQHDPETTRQIADARSQLDAITRIVAEIDDGDTTEQDAEMARLRHLLEQLEASPQILLREGLTLDWPDPMNIIPSRDMSHIIGFVGCEWVTERFYLSPEKVREIYGVDLGKRFTPHRPEDMTGPVRSKSSNHLRRDGSPEDGDLACVYMHWHRGDGLIYTVCDGYDRWLREPHAPDTWTERFWPWFAFAPNALDNPESPFPPSDVELMDTQQMEINRAGEGLRQHRHAARPGTVVAGSTGDEDAKKMAARRAHDILRLEGMTPEGDVRKLIQPFPTSPIDPNLYETNPAFMDIMRSVGTQQAQMGPTAGATATEASIAEASRGTSDDSAIDELDDVLTEMARAGGQILLMNLSQETVTKIAGPGAIWPAASKEEAAAEIYLEVEAGSSGRKNQAHEIQVRTQMYPMLMQVPGLSQEWVLKDMLKIMDPRINYEDAIDTNAASIIAMNGMQQAAANRGDPAAQGPAGASNAPTPEPAGAPGPKPADEPPPGIPLQ